MKKLQLLAALFLTAILAIVYSCTKDDAAEAYEPISPVELDLATVPYDSLSKYKFFEGEMKNLQPVYGVLPYDLNSALFTDYALKKRFVWMPKGAKATYTEDGKVLNFPEGTVLIKNFYYDNTVPAGTTIILETRLMIKKADGWIFVDYVWNAAQTEAVLNTEGTLKRMVWSQNGVTRNIMYKVPSSMECFLCHRSNNTAIPIGVKPQNLNRDYQYPEGTQNQLARWKAAGYLESYPTNIVSTVNWEDESLPTDLRVRSYLDINCGHCHTDGGQCDHPPLNLAFSKTNNPHNLGICVEPVDFVTGNQTYVVAGQDVENSLLHYRMSNNIPTEMMPFVGRTIVHDEALELIELWINSMEAPCP